MNSNVLTWLTTWYINNCDGDWEHSYGIQIETIDNPGWNVTIDLVGAIVDIASRDWKYIENGSDDWYGYKVEEGKFFASGDSTKLEFLATLFKDIVEGETDYKGAMQRTCSILFIT